LYRSLSHTYRSLSHTYRSLLTYLAAQVEFSLRFARERRLQEHLDVFGESFKFSIEDANDVGVSAGVSVCRWEGQRERVSVSLCLCVSMSLSVMLSVSLSICLSVCN